MQSTALRAKSHTVGRGPVRCARPRQLTVRSAVSDHSVRVRGDIKKVFKYLSDLRHYADFDDTIVECYKLGTPGRVTPGTRFEVVHSPFPTVNIPVSYEVAEMIPHKRIVFAGNNQNFSSTKTLALMTHPAQKEYTVVRQIVEYKMKDWKSMIPMLDVQLAKREESSAATLEKVLNSKSSPLLRLEMNSEDLRSSKSNGSSSSMSLDLDEQTTRLKDFGNMLGNLFTGIGSNGTSSANGQSNNGSSYNSQPAGASSSYSSYNSSSGNGNGNGRQYSSTATLVSADPLGYYQVLGLDTTKAISEDDIKAAFRVAAQQLHPDKMANADARTQQAAKIQFQILQAAYSTLKDPVKRSMYDKGQMSYSPDV